MIQAREDDVDKLMTIFRGIPGSGKTTQAIGLVERAPVANPPLVCCADDYPGLYTREGGVVKIDFSLLGPAHGACFRKAVEAAIFTSPPLVIANTNLTAVEVAPYVALAQAYGYRVELVRLVCPAEVAFARQQHGVPRAGFDRMVEDFNRNEEAPHWRFMPWITRREVVTG